MDQQNEKSTWRNSPWTAVIGFPILVLLVFSFFVLPRPDHHHHDPAQSCRNNLAQIELMKKVWSEDEGKSANDIPTAADLYSTNTFLREKLICPAGGTHTFGAVGQKPRCSIPGHTL